MRVSQVYPHANIKETEKLLKIVILSVLMTNQNTETLLALVKKQFFCLKTKTTIECLILFNFSFSLVLIQPNLAC